MIAGVFDSGVGGLTVVKSLLEHKLFSEIIYYGDTARVPYGTKDKNTIIRYSLEALEFFQNFKIDIFIAGCNTVSAYAINELKESSKVPVVGVIEPGVLAVENRLVNKNSNILVLGTKATIKSQKYETLLKQKGFSNINSIATSMFVPMVEEGIFEGAVVDEILKYYFHGIRVPEAIILGCTHFPLISKKINQYFSNSVLIHSGDAIVQYLIENYKINQTFQHTNLTLFASENPNGLKSVAKNWLHEFME